MRPGGLAARPVEALHVVCRQENDQTVGQRIIGDRSSPLYFEMWVCFFHFVENISCTLNTTGLIFLQVKMSTEKTCGESFSAPPTRQCAGDNAGGEDPTCSRAANPGKQELRRDQASSGAEVSDLGERGASPVLEVRVHREAVLLRRSPTPF